MVLLFGLLVLSTVTNGFVFHPNNQKPRISLMSRTSKLYERRTSDFSIESLKTLIFPKENTKEENVEPKMSVESLRKILFPPQDSSVTTTTEQSKDIPFFGQLVLPQPQLYWNVSRIQDAADPVQELLDEYSRGWALSYADLSPEKPDTPIGVSFLATNLAYFLAGMLLFMRGDALFGLLTDVTALASFNYHYTQLEASGKTKEKSVRLALLLDYICALTSIGVALFYTLTSSDFPLEGLGAGALALVCLGLCWVWEEGKPYMILHGLWHLLSAYAGYLVGATHLPP